MCEIYLILRCNNSEKNFIGDLSWKVDFGVKDLGSAGLHKE